ncbi:MAG: DUF3108 domain-containing protein [Candidatus Omnitrophica bacterium]|nr:DUF3108 domain-containing protein [Candidatus Omnitrophota bacterium]
MFKKPIIFLIVILNCADIFAGQNFTPANIKQEQFYDNEIIIEPAALKFPEYEKLFYTVRWLGIPVGAITASINGIKQINGRQAYELELTAKTNGFCSAIYRINDRFVSYVDTEKFYTLRHEVYREEGRYRKDAVTDFDYTAKKARFKNMLDKSEKVFDIPDGTQDTLSACYYFRLLNIDLGTRVGYQVCSNEDMYELFGVVESKRYVRVPCIGKVPAFYIQPYARINEEEVRKGRVSGYFSADSRRIPLLAAVQAPVFTEITAQLERADYGQK